MSKQTKIEPPDGWSVQTKYGTLRLRDGTDCVRLQDVHSWFLRDGTPASEVNWKMFSPLLDAAREACDGALDAPGELAACNACQGLDHDTVCKVLVDHGCMERSKDRWQYKARLPGAGGPVPCYKITSKLLTLEL